MNTTPLSLITIVAESVLQERLINDILRCGAKGYTLTTVQGEGSRHRRVSQAPEGNIKLESVVSDAVAERLLALLAAEYFPHYAVIAYTSQVHVIRGEKYV
jgi:hypothetical protein